MVYVTSKIAATHFSKNAKYCKCVLNRHLVAGVESVNFLSENRQYHTVSNRTKQIALCFLEKNLLLQAKVLISTFCLNTDD